MSTTVTKILISYEEYARLKELEKKFDTLASENTDLRSQLDKKGSGQCRSPGPSSEPSTAVQDIQQSGSGQLTCLGDFNLDHIATLVANKLKKAEEADKPNPRPTIINWQAYESAEPTNAVTFDYKSQAPLAYDQTIVKSDQNDSMDVRRVLKLIPKGHRSNAIKLLDSFEHRPDELSFNSSGVIFCRQTSIPGSNIFKFFPLLFKKRPKALPGFLDFVNQIHQMGLSHLIPYEPQHLEVLKSPQATAQKSANNELTAENWWYIGP